MTLLAQLDALRRTFASGRTRPREWRERQLRGVLQLLATHATDIGAALADDLGKSQFESHTTEIGYVRNGASHALHQLGTWMRPRRAAMPLVALPGSARIVPEPLGVVLIIGAWNYPVALTLAPLVDALAAGNCVVLKPSEQSPRTSTLLAQLLPRYVDPDALLVVEGGAEATTALLDHPFDHLLYTGGERVARIVMAAAAKHLTPVTLELGGKSPCIVLDDADLAISAARIVWAKFLNAGQTCIAPDYVLTTPTLRPRLEAAIAERIRAQFGDDPRASKDYGRIVSGRHVERLVQLLDGQRIIHGGSADVGARYVAPTLVADPAVTSRLMQEEIFGPVLPMLTVADLDAAIAFVAARPKPLVAYLFSGGAEAIARFEAGVSAGSLCINDAMLFMAAHSLPFGGVGASGMGRYTGRYGFETFSHLKPVMRRRFWPDPSLRYPPWTALKLRITRWLQ